MWCCLRTRVVCTARARVAPEARYLTADDATLASRAASSAAPNTTPAGLPEFDDEDTADIRGGAGTGKTNVGLLPPPPLDLQSERIPPTGSVAVDLWMNRAAESGGGGGGRGGGGGGAMDESTTAPSSLSSRRVAWAAFDLDAPSPPIRQPTARPEYSSSRQTLSRGGVGSTPRPATLRPEDRREILQASRSWLPESPFTLEVRSPFRLRRTTRGPSPRRPRNPFNFNQWVV